MAKKKEQDVTELLNLSTMKFIKAKWYYITNSETGWRWVMQTPAGLWLDVFTNKDRTVFDVYLDKTKYIPGADVQTLFDKSGLELFEAQCLVYDYWRRGRDGSVPAAAA